MQPREIFATALEIEDSAQREAYLAECCQGNDALRAQMDQLLQSHAAAGSFLEIPPVVVSGLTEAAGETVSQSQVEQGTDGPQSHNLPDSDSADQELVAQKRDASAAAPGNAAPAVSEPAVSARAGASGAIDSSAAAPPDVIQSAGKRSSLGRLGNYDLLEVIGRGGMGIVFKAFDEKLHRVVAIKMMAGGIAGSGAALKRFSREAKAAAAVMHDNIVPIHFIEDDPRQPYIVMQFVEGRSLQQKLNNDGSLELREVLRIGMQIARGLAAAHKQGLVHRDIKPANILLENDLQRVKITDFGLARAMDDASVSQSEIVAGTPQYMSPEQAEGKTVDHRSDLFSLGSVMYAMCTGRAPFRASSTIATMKRVCEEPARPIRELSPEFPQWLCEIVDRLLEKAPDRRFQTAQEVADLLEAKLNQVQRGYLPEEESPPPKPSKPTPQSPTSPYRSNPILNSLSQIASVLVSVGLLFSIVWPRYSADSNMLMLPASLGFALLMVVSIAYAAKDLIASASQFSQAGQTKLPGLRRGYIWLGVGFIAGAMLLGIWLVPKLWSSPKNDIKSVVPVRTQIAVEWRVLKGEPNYRIELNAFQTESPEKGLPPGVGASQPLLLDDGSEFYPRTLAPLSLEESGVVQKYRAVTLGLPGKYRVFVRQGGKVVYSEEVIVPKPVVGKPFEIDLPMHAAVGLQGSWRVVSAEHQQKAVPLSELGTMAPSLLTFKGGQYRMTLGDKNVEGAFTANPKLSPAQIDFSGSSFEGLVTRQAIYQLDGNDRLTLCFSSIDPKAESPRPFEFKTWERAGNLVVVYERVKEPTP